MGDTARATQRYEESVLSSCEEADQSDDLISFAVPDVSLQQSPPSCTDREPGLHKAGEQHEEHPMPERNRDAGVHSNPTVLVKNMAVFLL